MSAIIKNYLLLQRVSADYRQQMLNFPGEEAEKSDGQ